LEQNPREGIIPSARFGGRIEVHDERVTLMLQGTGEGAVHKELGKAFEFVGLERTGDGIEVDDEGSVASTVRDG
jgi:hypothetical protein